MISKAAAAVAIFMSEAGTRAASLWASKISSSSSRTVRQVDLGAFRSDSTAENSRASRSLDALLVSTDIAGDPVLAVAAD